MKTLKQLLQEFWDVTDTSELIYIDKTLKAVRVWLQQLRPEHTIWPKRGLPAHRVIDELLEELDK